MEAIKLKHSDMWNGRYRGVRFEIMRWHFTENGKDHWAYYLYIDERQFPVSVRSGYVLEPGLTNMGRLSYDYTNCAWNNIRAHCGWTFYEIHGGYIDTPRVVKIGCDYGHLWDDGISYNENCIIPEVKQSIDELHDKVGVFLIWSHCDGNYRTEADTEAFNAEYSAKRKAAL